MAKKEKATVEMDGSLKLAATKVKVEANQKEIWNTI